jgi:hypothetical protein
MMICDDDERDLFQLLKSSHVNNIIESRDYNIAIAHNPFPLSLNQSLIGIL